MWKAHTNVFKKYKKKLYSKVGLFRKNEKKSLSTLTVQTSRTVKFMFSNVAYRAKLYIKLDIGSISNRRRRPAAQWPFGLK